MLVMEHMVNSKDTVLDVGCGSGMVYSALKELTSNGELPGYSGIDVSKEMLSIAKRRNPEAHWKIGDAYKLPIEDKSNSVVTCFEVLGHIPYIANVIKELIRTAKRWVIFTTWITKGTEITKGTDHMEYPLEYVMNILHTQGLDKVRVLQMPYTYAFIVDLT
jgi:ubiquinone/menaquinone biosynthesis C-methylase UbiE